MDKKYRWGIIGTGYIAHAFAKALIHVPDAETYALGSCPQESADKFTKEFNIPTSYGDYQKVFDCLTLMWSISRRRIVNIGKIVLMQSMQENRNS